MLNHPRIPEERDLPPGRLQLRKEHLMNEVAAHGEATRRRRRRLAFVLVPATLVLLVATGFTTYALTREPTHFESIGCFEEASEESNTAIVAADGRDPVEICTEVWRQGAFGAAATPERLEACVLASGAIGVFPRRSPSTCEQLGLAPLPASYTDRAAEIAELQEAFVRHLGAPPSGSSVGDQKCVGEEAARAAVRRELDERGYSDWAIEVAGEGFTDERPCAEASIDPVRKVVTLIPVWR